VSVICVDIDGVLAEDSGDHRDYASRVPLLRGIELCRRLHAAGHTVVLHTARFKVDRQVTERWLARHGVHYHKLILGKPRADLYIDDRGFEWSSRACAGEVLGRLAGTE